MVTNVPFYSFKDLSIEALGAVHRHRPDRARHRRHQHPRRRASLFGLFVVYGVSGYGVYIWKKMKGKPVSVIATSTDEPDEQGLHH